MKKLLIACEFSGKVREAMRKKGVDAWSCDLLPSDVPGNHIQEKLENVIGGDWDGIIAHPPCTRLAVSGARWFYLYKKEQEDALDFVRMIFDAKISKKCIENPVSIISSRIKKPSQIIHPWQYGHGETKATCLWLENLPLLVPEKIVPGREPRIHRLPPSPNRWKLRSETYQGIADAMANQWSSLFIS